MTRHHLSRVLGVAGILGIAACVERGDARSAQAGKAPGAPIVAAQLSSRAALELVVAPTGNEVRYRVREQLAGVDLPNDAIGRTTAVTGGLAVDSAGKVITGASSFVVDVTGLKSDRDRRDGFVQFRILETKQYPTVTFVPASIKGLALPLPASGTRDFSVTGTLTVKGVARAAIWHATASFANGKVTGTASTGFTFDDYSIQKPQVPVVLSVADSIHLEYDFTLVPAGQ